MLMDSDILIAFIRGDVSAKEKIDELLHNNELLQISVITACELWQGVFLSQNIPKNTKILQKLLENFKIIDLMSEDAIQYGKIYADLQREGNIIGFFDMLIASIAIRRNEGLITHNIQHFERIPLLKIEDWKRGKDK